MKNGLSGPIGKTSCRITIRLKAAKVAYAAKKAIECPRLLLELICNPRAVLISDIQSF
jgi:hypothetical protein